MGCGNTDDCLQCYCLFYHFQMLQRKGRSLGISVFQAAAVLAIGIIDRLGYDFLIMHDEIPLQYNIFISTIGNVNFWAGYLSIIIPFFMLAVLFTKNRFARFFIYLLLLAAYFSLFITLTNTTYIGIGIAALFVVWYSLCKVNRLKKSCDQWNFVRDSRWNCRSLVETSVHSACN